MKRPGLTIVLIGLAAALAVSGAVAAAQSPAAPAPDPMQFARGAQAWADNCGRCHNLRAPQEYADKDWALIATHMRVRANLSAQDTRDIEAFLKASN